MIWKPYVSSLAWKPYDSLELALVGQNLLASHHPEFYSLAGAFSNNAAAAEIERSVYGKVTWRFR